MEKKRTIELNTKFSTEIVSTVFERIPIEYRKNHAFIIMPESSYKHILNWTRQA